MSAKCYSGQIFSKNIPLYYNLIQLVVQGWHSIFTAILNKKKSPAFSLKDNSVKYSSKTTTINKVQSLVLKTPWCLAPFVILPPFRFTGDWRVNRMEAETDTGRQPGHLRKNGNKKRQISVRENWRAKNSHYYTELHRTIMPMQCYTCPEEEQCFF